jgi:glycosyltransferase involved in cell wall biosynthesis
MAAEPVKLNLLLRATASRPSAGIRPGVVGHILIVAYTHYIFDARVKRHAEALAQNGYAVDVICLADQFEGQTPVNIIGIAVPRYRGHSRIEYLRQYLRFFTKATYTAAKLNRKYRYDVVIVCSLPDAAIVAGLIPKLSGSKLILDMHDTMPELYLEKFPGIFGAIGAAALRVEERVSARAADLVFAVHDLHAARLQRTGIAREKIVVILNTPDPRLFQPIECYAEKNLNDFTVVTHGTINRRLGLDTAIEAINLVRHQITGLKFRVIGPGEYREQVREHVRRRRLENVIQFEDGVPLEALAAALREASIGLVPNESTAATELMLPVKLLEYVSLGIPVVASSLQTVRHYFPDDAICYFQPSNPQALAENLVHLHRHRTQLIRLASRAHEVAKSISWRIQRQILCGTIDQLIERERTNQRWSSVHDLAQDAECQ